MLTYQHKFWDLFKIRYDSQYLTFFWTKVFRLFKVQWNVAIKYLVQQLLILFRSTNFMFKINIRLWVT